MWMLSIHKNGLPLVVLPLPIRPTSLQAAGVIVSDQVQATQQHPQDFLEVWICRHHEGELVQEHRLVDPFRDALLPDCMDVLASADERFTCCPMLRSADVEICRSLEFECLRACIQSLPAGSAALAANRDYLREIYTAAVPESFCVNFSISIPEQLTEALQIRICKKHLLELSDHTRKGALLLVYVPLYTLFHIITFNSACAEQLHFLLARAFLRSKWALRVRVVSTPSRLWVELPNRMNFRLSEADPDHLYACCRECEV